MSSEPSRLSRIQEQILRWNKSIFRYFQTQKKGLLLLKKTVLYTGIILCTLVLAWIGLRTIVLHWAFDKAVHKFETKGYTLQCHNLAFSGLFTLQFDNINLSVSPQKQAPSTQRKNSPMSQYQGPYTGKTILSCSRMKAGLAVWKFWNIGLSDLETDSLTIDLVNLPSNCNYCGLLGDDDPENREENKTNRDPIVALFRQLEKWIAKAPSNLRMTATSLKLLDTTGISTVLIPETLFKNNFIRLELRAFKNTAQHGKIAAQKTQKTIHLMGNTVHKTASNPTEFRKEIAFVLEGEIDKDDLSGHIQIAPFSNQKYVRIPIFLNGLGFEKAEFEVMELSESSGAIHADLRGGFTNFRVDDARISDTLVQIDSAHGRFVCQIKDNFFELDSQSSVKLNTVTAGVFAHFQGGNNANYACALTMPRIPANVFFSSLPNGLFRNVGILKATGSLAYRFRFELHNARPEACILESKMWPSKDFAIYQWGKVDPRRINGDFRYTYWENGMPTAQFMIGSSNPNFTSLPGISPDLIHCVLRSEDPDFFYHKGFYIDAFRSSIAQNYRQKRFARGGSTISMQLVKNVFLGRRKTIARKIEEILLTWLIERQTLVSKNRILEVYLNAIEWGPGIFGIAEASQFYFHKSPKDINLGECTFLASIIPMPKKVRWFLDSTGCVKQGNGHFRSLKNRLLSKDSGSIDTNIFKVCIHPEAWKQLKGKDPIPKEDIAELPIDETQGIDLTIDFINPEKK